MEDLKNIFVSELSESDLAYWVARANLRGTAQERNVLRGHYACCPTSDPRLVDSMRTFVANKLGPVLPARQFWH